MPTAGALLRNRKRRCGEIATSKSIKQTALARAGFGRPLRLGLILLVATAAFVLVACAYWPGIMIDDTRWQYQQVVDNAFEDWHPPLMAWIWRQLTAIEPGPAPILALQLALGWAGIVLVTTSLWKRGHSRVALFAALVPWLPAPLALSGTVSKDWLMAGALTFATGILLWRDLISATVLRISLSILTILLLMFAAALRLNAMFACVPLALAVLPRSWLQPWPKLVAAAAGSALIFLGVGPLVNRLVHAENTGVELSLITFDLGGITEHAGVSVFPDLGVDDPVAANHRCYDPVQWDSYSSWAKRPCPVGFDAMQSAVDDDDIHPAGLWLHAVAAHPMAYAVHRLAHFNLSTCFLVGAGPDFTAWSQSVDNPWRFRIHDGPVVQGITAFTDAAARTPLGWPIFWIALSFAALVLAMSIRAPAAVVAIPASASLYGLGFLVVGVAVGMRYYLWTITGAALAPVMVATELWDRRPPDLRRKLHWPAAIVGLPTLLAIGSRLLLD